VDATPMHCAVHALCGPCMTRSRVGTLRSGAQYPREALFKGRNIQELSVGTHRSGTHQPCILHEARGQDNIIKGWSDNGDEMRRGYKKMKDKHRKEIRHSQGFLDIGTL
jgi:hypothetical protein